MMLTFYASNIFSAYRANNTQRNAIILYLFIPLMQNWYYIYFVKKVNIYLFLAGLVHYIYFIFIVIIMTYSSEGIYIICRTSPV